MDSCMTDYFFVQKKIQYNYVVLLFKFNRGKNDEHTRIFLLSQS